MKRRVSWFLLVPPHSVGSPCAGLFLQTAPFPFAPHFILFFFLVSECSATGSVAMGTASGTSWREPGRRAFRKRLKTHLFRVHLDSA